MRSGSCLCGAVRFEVRAEAMTTKESDVAEAIWNAVHDSAGQLRFPAGPDAVALARTR